MLDQNALCSLLISLWHLKRAESIFSCYGVRIDSVSHLHKGKCESKLTDPLHRVNSGRLELTTALILTHCRLLGKRPEVRLTSSDSRSSSVSSTCTTASAPHGMGAPVVTLITWPGITVWVGCTETRTGSNTRLKLKWNYKEGSSAAQFHSTNFW